MQLKTRLFKLFAFTVFLTFLVSAVAYKSRLANEESNSSFTSNDTTKKSKDSLNEIIVVGYSPKHGRLIDPARKKADSSQQQKDSLSKAALRVDTGRLPITADTTHHHN